MTSAFDRKTRELLARGGEPSTTDIITVITASHEDAEEGREFITKQMARIVSHLESEQGHIEKALEEHFKEAAERDERIALMGLKLEACPMEIRDEHLGLHAEHMAEHHAPQSSRAGDPVDADFSDLRSEEVFRTRFMWATGAKMTNVLLVVLGGVVMLVINLLIFGRP